MGGFDDITDIFKFWRIFRNILNFRQLGLMRQIGLVTTILVLALGFSLTFVNLDKMLLGAFELTPQDEPVMEACLKTYEISEMEFTEVSNLLGCACTTKMATSLYAGDELNTFLNAHAILMNTYSRKWSARTDEQINQLNASTEAAYGRLRKASGMETAAYTELVERMESIDKTCDAYASYEGEALTKLAALRPLGYEDMQLAKGVNAPSDPAVSLRLRGATEPVNVASQ